jgi:intraflagellar transport protein 88
MNAPGTSFNSRGPNTAFRPLGTAVNRSGVSSMGRGNNQPISRGGMSSRAGLTTGMVGGGSSEPRPMTSVSGAGYKGSISNKENKAFDPLNLGKGPAPPLAEKSDNSPEDKAKEMEKKVHRLIEATAEAIVSKDMLRALEKAREAGKAERAVCKFRESHGLADHINLDLTYVICFNLADAYYHNKLYDEALNTYQLIVKNKHYPQSGRLRVNMGNIYYEQKKYPQAIKMYRMALDQVPVTGKELRYKILRNIGNAFIQLGQFQDAYENYETVLNTSSTTTNNNNNSNSSSSGSADIQTAFNALLCLYARGDKEKMRKQFINMLRIPVPGLTEEDAEKFLEQSSSSNSNQSDHLLLLSDQEDLLRIELTNRIENANEKILTGARLIAPVIDDKNDWENGYRWIIEQLRTEFDTILSKFEIDLSMMYMKKRHFEEAISVLKNFERKDLSLRAIAGTNLSFIYFLEGDYLQAERHADAAIKSDRYNAKALVNKGNCLYVANELARAREMYLEAVGVEADCVEAIYNLGLVNLRLNNYDEARSAFDKLVTSLPAMTEALYQLAAIYERSSHVDDLENAAKTYQLLLNKVPGDPTICCKLGQIYEKLQDDVSACHWHSEAHRTYPVNLNVISWLGVWYVKREMYEQAIDYFQQAAIVQPCEIKWQLMVTSCYRRLGDLYKALELYQKIHEDHPENIEALTYLEALCRDLGRNHEEYSKKLEKLRRNQPAPPMNNNNNNNQQNNQQNNNSNAMQPPQRTERPNRERSERPPPTNNNNNKNINKVLDDFNEPGLAPSSFNKAPGAGGGGGARGGGRVGVNKEEEDDFGDTDVAGLLF